MLYSDKRCVLKIFSGKSLASHVMCIQGQTCDKNFPNYRACLGLPAQNYMMLEHKVPTLMAGLAERKQISSSTQVKVPSPVVPQSNGVHLNGATTNGVH